MFVPEIIPTEIQELCESRELLVVSGLPMIKWGVDGKDVFYGANEEVFAMPFVPRLLTTAIIHDWANPTLDPRFYGEYGIVIGDNPRTQDEYQFGVLSSLNFELVLGGITDIQE